MSDQPKTVKTESYKAYKFKQKIIPYLFLTPNLLIFGIFIILPALIGVYYSFHDIELLHMDELTYVGFQNYINLFKDKEFTSALLHTILLVILTVPLIYVISLSLALLIVKPLRAKGLFRASYYWPVMISALVVGVIWYFIVNGSSSMFNSFWTSLGFAESDTLGDPVFAWATVIIAIVWSRAGYYMIIFMAALLSIPVSLYEAADVDGATKWQKFWGVTYPSLRASRVMVMILVVMEIFKTYPIIVQLTAGGPNDSTMFVVQKIYETAFVDGAKEIGYASAMSIILLIFVTIISAVNFAVNKGGTD